MRNSSVKRMLGIVLASTMLLQMSAPTVYANNEASDSIVMQGDPVLVQESEDNAEQSDIATSETADDQAATAETADPNTSEDTETSNIPEDTVFTVTINPNGGHLPAEWIKTANGVHENLETESGTLDVTEQEDGTLVVKVQGRSSLSLMNPTSPNTSKYFSGWECNTGNVNDENSVLTFDGNTTEYTLTACYEDVVSESDKVENARTYTEITEQEDSGAALFALKPSDSYSKLELAMEGLEFVYEDGQIQTFTAPYDGEYVITAFGANGGTGRAEYDGYGVPGRGGMTEATVTLKEGQTIYLYLGEAGGDWSTERTFGGGGAGCDEEHAWVSYSDNSLHIFGRGGGATYVSIDEFDMANAGQAAQDFTAEQQAQNDAAAAEAKKHVIMLAAGGGGAGEYGSPYVHIGLSGGGYEGTSLYAPNHYQGYLDKGMMTYDATVGGRTLSYEERINAQLWPATQTRAGYGYHYSINGELYDPNPANRDPVDMLWPEREARNWGSFFFGANAMACTGAGGGGWFGGGTDYSFDGGGGSSYIGTSVSAQDGTTVTIKDGTTTTGGNIRYDSTKSSPFYVNGRVLIRLKDGNADMYAVLQKAADEDVSRNHPDTVNNDEYGQGVVMQPSQTVANETVGYTALIYYSPADAMTVTPQWQYSTYLNQTFRDWNDSVAKSIYSGMSTSVKNEDLGVLSPGDPYYRDEYSGYRVMKSTLTITNVPLSMWNTEGSIAYYFHCKATGQYVLSGKTQTMERETMFGGLTATYPIALHHNGVNTYSKENTINGAKTVNYNDIETATKGHDYSDWKYPQLDVVTSKTIKSFTVEFTGSYDSKDALYYNTGLASQYGLRVTGNSHAYTFESDAGLNESQWESFLRDMTFRTYDPMEVNASGITGGAHVKWSGYEEVIHPDRPFNTQMPGSYTASYNLANGDANIYSSGTYYITGTTSTNRVYINPGVTATIVLDNVNMSCRVEDSDNSSYPDYVFRAQNSNLTFILKNSNTINGYSFDDYATPNWASPNVVWVMDLQGSNVTIQGDGTLFASAKHPSPGWQQLLVRAMWCGNYTQNSGNVQIYGCYYSSGFSTNGMNVSGGSFRTDGYDGSGQKITAGSITVSNGANFYTPVTPSCGCTVSGGSTIFSCPAGASVNVQPNSGFRATGDGRTYVAFEFDPNTRDIWDTDVIGTTVSGEFDYEFTKDPATISGRVWGENDNDGLFKPSEEPVVSGVTVTLKKKDGSTVKTTTTDEYGAYSFSNVQKGEYKVSFDIQDSQFPDRHEAVKKRADGTTGDIVNSAVNGDYTTDVFTVDNGANITTMNCGVYVPGHISGYVWDDVNQNGIFEDGEEKVQNVTVTLYCGGNIAKDAYGNEFKAVLTDSKGEYFFDNVPESNTPYHVSITSSDKVHIDNAVVSPLPGDDVDDSIANFATEVTYGDISAGTSLDQAMVGNIYVGLLGDDFRSVSIPYRNCALSVTSYINGYVWAETDYDGICDGFSYTDVSKATEPLLSNVEVTLKDKDGQVVTKTVTTKTGYYEFKNVTAGQYTVEFTKADEFTANGKVNPDNTGFDPFIETVQADTTTSQIGNNSTGVYEDGIMMSMVSSKITIKQASLSGASADTSAYCKVINAGLFAPSHVSGKVWEDYNQDGIRTDDEECLDDVTVTLLKLTGSDASAEASYTPVQVNGKDATVDTGNRLDVITGEITAYETDGTGAYSFDNLPTGIYAVKFSANGTYDMRFYLASELNVGEDDTRDNDAAPTYTEDEEELVSAFISNITIPSEADIAEYGYDNTYNDFGAYQKLRDVTVTKQIRADEIEWDHGTPTFMVTVYGTDQKGVLHEFNHAYEFTQEYVKENTDENGVVSMTYTFEGIPYARIYNVEEQNTSRYVLEQISGSENATFENETAILDLKYNVSGEVTFLNKVAHYRDTSANSLVINSLLAG